MGRAKGDNQLDLDGGMELLSRAELEGERVTISMDEVWAASSGSGGELLDLPSGAMFQMQEGDPEMFRGLARVRSVTLERPDIYRVLFTGDYEALVNVETREVAINADSRSMTTAALHAALAARAAQYPDRLDPVLQQKYGPLAEAHAAWLDDPHNPDAFRAYALAAAAAGQDEFGEDEELLANPAELLAELRGVELEPSDEEKMQEIMLSSLHNDIASAIEADSGSTTNADPLMYAVAADGQINRPEDLFAQGREAASELGVDILESGIEFDDEGESVGPFYCGPEEKAVLTQIRTYLESGARSIRIKGPAAAGKGSIVRELSAVRRCPLVVVDISSETDPVDMFMQKEIVGEEREIPMYGTDGEPLRDASGDVKMQKVPSIAVTEDVATLFGDSLQKASVIELAELQNIRNIEVLHSLFDQNVADPHNRRVVVNGEVIKVHPECVIFATYNTGKEDYEMEPATASRFSPIVMDAPSPEVHSRRVAAEVNAALLRDARGELGPQTTFGGLAATKTVKDDDGSERIELEKPITPEQVEVVVKACNLLATAGKTAGAGKVRHEISPRMYPQVALGLLKYGYLEHKSPVDAEARRFRDILASPEARSKAYGNLQDMDDEIREMLREYRLGLEELAAIGRAQKEAEREAATGSSGKKATKKEA